LASSTELADEVIEKCRAANVRLMVGHSQRFLPAVATIKSVLDSGVLGAPGLLRIHHWESSDSNNRLARHRVSSEMDLAIWLFSELPSQIYALVRGPVATAVESSDYLQVHLGFLEGGMALIDFAATLPHGGAGYYSISMIGSTGATYGDDHHNMQLLYGAGEPTALKTAQGCGHLLAQLQEFVDSIAQNRDPAITGADGRLAIQVAQAIDLSISSGRAVHRDGERYELV
jgi:predicted dehydrogenase